MIKRFRSLIGTYLYNGLDFRMKMAYVIGIVGLVASVTTAIAMMLNGESAFNITITLILGANSLGLICFLTFSKRHWALYLNIAMFICFLICLPAIYFAGGYSNTMPIFFIFAVMLTVLLLEGKALVIILLIEMVVYNTMFVFNYFYPNRVEHASALAILFDNIISFTIISLSLIATTLLLLQIKNQQERALQAARDEALQFAEAKNAFLSNMSHEIRTPINIMLGMTEMVLRESRDEIISDYAKKIQNAGKMLHELVSNVLDLSKIEAGKLEMTEDCYRTDLLIQELFLIGSESTRKRELGFNVEVDKKLPAELWGDMSKIKRIASNFLSNAAKYTDSGSVILNFSSSESENENQTILCISVTDTGIGIRKEKLQILFDAFSRLDQPAHRDIEGSGLGLAIAKELTEHMNGRIFVESEYGTGSVFLAEIPQKIVNKAPIGDWKSTANNNESAPEESFAAPSAKVLVVDDNLDNLNTVKALLRRTLMRVDLVENGAQCLNAVRKTDYNIILMDYMMPDMNGIETFKRLREELPGFNTPVIALTANAISGMESRFLDEGFFAYITKPVQAKKLEETLVSGLALTSVPITKTIMRQKVWISSEMKENLAHALALQNISLNDGLKNAGGDISLLAAMSEIFAKNNQTTITQMQNLTEASNVDFDGLYYLAHSLKSNAGYVGAMDLSYLAKLVEKGCKDKNSRIIELAAPLLYYELENTKHALTTFAESVRAVEPDSTYDANRQLFQPEKLISYIENGMRRNAIQELDLLIAEKGMDYSKDLFEVKREIQALNFDKAIEILAEMGISRVAPTD